MTLEELLHVKREEILKVCAKYGARNVRVFGSGVYLQEVWRTVERDLPVLKRQTEALVKRLEEQGYGG
jgi:uncharacterized protein with HEPN domain